MGTTADKLALLKANKEAIRDAITEKIGEDAGEVMSTYAEKIRGIESKPKYYRTTILLDQTITDPATMITKVYDDGGIAMIRANSHRYVCKFVDGVLEAKQLQDSNGTLYLDGTTADLTGSEGDVFMKLPEFWYRAYSKETDKWHIDFAYGSEPDASYRHWDGKDFIGVYEAYALDSLLYSRSGVVSSANISQENFKAYARNRGNGYTLVKWEHHCIMAFLFYAEYLNTNSQVICGAGTDSFEKTMGQTDLLGMTDTSASSNGNAQSINFCGLENWWGNKYEFIDNVEINRFAEDKAVVYVDENDGTVRTITGMMASDSYFSKMLIGYNVDAIAVKGNGSTTSGFCDYSYYSSSQNRVMQRSGAKADNNGGISMLSALQSSSNTAANRGSRLAYRGEYKIIE